MVRTIISNIDKSPDTLFEAVINITFIGIMILAFIVIVNLTIKICINNQVPRRLKVLFKKKPLIFNKKYKVGDRVILITLYHNIKMPPVFIKKFLYDADKNISVIQFSDRTFCKSYQIYYIKKVGIKKDMRPAWF